MSSSASLHEANPFVSTEICVYFHVFAYSGISQTPRRRHLVFTLDPNKFAEKKQQRLHIGGRERFRLHIRLHNQYYLVKSSHFRLVYDNMNIESGPGKYSNPTGHQSISILQYSALRENYASELHM